MSIDSINRSKAPTVASPAQPTQASQPKSAAPSPAPANTGWNPLAQLERKVASAAGLTAYAPLQAPPVLKRPVVMIPGLTMKAASFDNLSRNLASNPANGKVAVFVAADGKFHQGASAGPVMTDAQVKAAKIVQLEFSNPKLAPSELAPEVGAALREVKRLTGAPDLDVVTHSAGGHDFRQYLDTRSGADANVAIHRTVMIGPVAHGTVMGNVGAALGGPMGLTKASQELGIGSERVKALDATWDKQRAQIAEPVTIIAVSGAPTLGPGGIQTGDGYVQTDEAVLPGAKTIVLRGSDPTPLAHLHEVGYSGVVNQVQTALGQN